jgi:Flp pilus assembly pilin Flp
MLSLRCREEGQGSTEYALILSFVAIVAVVALNFIGPAIRGILYDIVGCLQGRCPATGLVTYLICPLSSNRPSLDGSSIELEIEFTYPTQCAHKIATTIYASGTYSGDLTGKDIWIMVYPTDHEYYPQTVNACGEVHVNIVGGEWNTIINFGGPPQQYDIIAAVADVGSEASLEFRAWLQNGCVTRDFPGYLSDALPGGLTEVAAITVTRN